jgi:regulator of protease activity HflC (stomatin/prohibitin superfamily)
MKLVIDLDDTCSYEESISAAIKESIEAEIGKEVRKLVRAAVDENKSVIIAVADAYAKRMVAEAEKALR